MSNVNNLTPENNDQVKTLGKTKNFTIRLSKDTICENQYYNNRGKLIQYQRNVVRLRKVMKPNTQSN